MPERLSKKVADDLLERVARGEYKPGDRLPSEATLMAEYGVGRNTIREAMQGLRTLGLVEIRPRLGATVLSGRADITLASSAMSALLNDQTVIDLYEVRLVLEPAAAAKAASHRTERDIEAIRRALTHFRVAFEMGSPIWQADIEFHQAVAEASGNSVFSRILAPMSDLLIHSRQATGAIPEAAERAFGEHQEIAEAIFAGSSKLARAAMTTHIRSAMWALSQLKDFDPTASALDHHGMNAGPPVRTDRSARGSRQG